jgi:hypothetical protein
LSPSTDRGVGHVETIFTTPGSDTVIFDPSSRLPVALAVPIPWPPSPSAFVGVGHVVVNTAWLNLSVRPLFITLGAAPSFQSRVVSVAHVEGDPVEALANVRGVDRESWEIDSPAGVTFSRQISAHSVEPTIASLSRNLFSHDDRGPDGCDEAMEVGP